MASPFLRFLDHTQRRTTVGRTPLDEWTARRRDLYLKTHNTHNRQTSMPPVGFEPTISAGERPQTYALDRAATGTGRVIFNKLENCASSWFYYRNISRCTVPWTSKAIIYLTALKVSETTSIDSSHLYLQLRIQQTAILFMHRNSCILYPWAGIAQSVKRFATGWTVRGSNPRGWVKVSLLL